MANTSIAEMIAMARKEGERAGRAVEREACAKLANPLAPNGMVSDYEEGWIDACEKIAAAIRARGR